MVIIEKIRKHIKTYIIFILIFISSNYIHVLALYSKNSDKTVYLTFEDSPSISSTRNIIKILNNNNVKATFFVLGDAANIYPYLIKELDENKMCIMPNCNVKDYKYIYKSEKNYFNDLNKCKENISSITYNKKMNFIRMPGGSKNEICNEKVLSNIKEKILEDNSNYIDWTVSILSKEEGVEVSEDNIKSKIREEGALYNVEVVRMNDFVNQNSKILQEIIDFYKEKGYKFKTLDDIEEREIEYLKEINVLNK